MTAVRCPGENQVCTSYKEYVGSNFGIELLDQNQTFVDFILEKVDNYKMAILVFVGHSVR